MAGHTIGSVKAIYRGRLATVTECMGNPNKPSGRDELPPRFLVSDAGDPATDEQAVAIGALWDMDGVVLDDELWVSLMDPDLIEDPTDRQVAAADAGRPIPVEPDDITF